MLSTKSFSPPECKNYGITFLNAFTYTLYTLSPCDLNTISTKNEKAKACSAIVAHVIA